MIQTLRIKDIDLDEGVLHINEEVEGRKGASGKRPLLGAKKYVRDWLEYHPTKGPKDYLITPSATGGGEPGGMLTQDTIRYHLEKAADNADVDKDVHPHIFRHYFTTIAKRDYDMDDAYIKQLRGDAPGSNVMETTYQHLFDDDAVEHAKVKTGEKEPERESPLTPKSCPTCGEILDPDAKACEACGDVFTPDAEQTKRTMQEQTEEMIVEVDSEFEQRMVQHTLKEIRENLQKYLNDE